MQAARSSISRAFLLATAATLFSSCSQQTLKGTSHLSFQLLDRYDAGLMAHVKDPKITLCVDNESNDPKWQVWAKNAVLSWIEPLRSIASSDLTTDVEIEDGSKVACAKSQATINVSAENFRAYTEPGDSPVINVSDEDARHGRVALHEMGHAFGLDDTYVDGMDTDEPDSVMKTATFDRPVDDDIKGIRADYYQYWGHEPAKQPSSTGSGLFVAIASQVVNGRYPVYAAANTTVNPASVRYCVGDSHQCANSSAKWFTATAQQHGNGAAIFILGSGIDPSQDKLLTIQAQAQDNQILLTRTVEFDLKNAKNSYDIAVNAPLLNGDVVRRGE